jgi:predicted ATPase
MTIARKRRQASSEHDTSGHIAALEVKDFKSLKSVKLDLGQVNVFVGANGSGKSCLLEAVGILGSCAAGLVDSQSLLRRGVRPGVPKLYKSSFAGERMAPKISLRATSSRGVSYHAYITNPSKRLQWVFGNESLTDDKGNQMASRGPSGNATVLDLSVPLENDRSITTVVRARQDTPLAVRTFLAALDDFAIFAPVTPVLRGIAPDTAQRSPVGLFGGQLPEALGLLIAQDKGKRALSDAFTLIDWASDIKVGEPSRRLVSPSVPTSRYVVQFVDAYMARNRNVLSGYDASEGALYILFMLVLAMHGQSPTVCAIDNFDQALNPRTARALTRTFVRHVLSQGRQALLTTHNPLVLDGLDLDDPRVRLFAVSRDGAGHTKVRAQPVKDLGGLKKKHGEFALSRLWINGRLGGMPDNV